MTQRQIEMTAKYPLYPVRYIDSSEFELYGVCVQAVLTGIR